MVTRQRLRVGATHAGKIVTVYVEDTHFRVTCDGTEIALHPRNEQRPVTSWRAKIHTPKPQRCPASPETVNQVVSRSCQACPETTHHTHGNRMAPRIARCLTQSPAAAEQEVLLVNEEISARDRFQRAPVGRDAESGDRPGNHA